MNQIVCQQHNLPYTQLRMSSSKSKLMCEECVVNLTERSTNLQSENVIYLRKAAISAPYLLSKTKINSVFPSLFDNLQNFNENDLKIKSSQLENKIKQIQTSLGCVLKEIQEYISFTLLMRQQLLIELQKIISFEQFEQLVVELGKENNNYNKDIVTQIEMKFYQYFNEIQNSKSGRLIKQIKDLLQSYTTEYSQFPNQIFPKMLNQFNTYTTEFNQMHTNFFTTTQQKYEQYLFEKIDASKLLSFEKANYLTQLIENKSNKKITSDKIIYIGSRDGLNANSFWNIINGRKNLLMIFRSKSYFVFGGYSPCQWMQNQQATNYKQDDTLTSFLFSSTHDEVYPLNVQQKQYAIGCYSNRGPQFGQSDLKINADFQGGSSNLGKSYQLNDQQAQNSFYLFGEEQPNITECEIYQLTFE